MDKILKPTYWRYERKFFISELDKHQVEQIIKMHPAMFSEIYQERQVNNIYLDSYAMTNFFKSVDGQSRRLKIRIRWYGSQFGIVDRPILELKIKNGLLGTKMSFPLIRLNVDKELTNKVIREVLNGSNLPEQILDLMKIFDITLLNTYRRKYFQTADKKYRITIDSSMKFIGLAANNNTYSNELNDHRNVVAELKYDEPLDDEAQFITNYLPFRMTKSSKYVTGVENILKTIN